MLQAQATEAISRLKPEVLLKTNPSYAIMEGFYCGKYAQFTGMQRLHPAWHGYRT